MSKPLTDEPKRILIIRLSSLGDITHCIPVAYNIRKNYPECRIVWLTREKYREILEINEDIDEIIEIFRVSQSKNIAREIAFYFPAQFHSSVYAFLDS